MHACFLVWKIFQSTKMSSNLGITDYVIVGIMLTISTVIGFYFRFTGGRQKTTSEYLMADRKMGILPVTFSIMATTFDAVSFLGSPAESYLYGLSKLVIQFSISVAMLLTAYIFVPVYFDSGSNTVYDYLEKRFGKRIKVVASLFYTLQMVLFMPICLYAPSLALSTVTGLSLWTSVLILALVCIFYSTLGGLKAVMWTDFFQAFLMMFTALLLVIKCSLDFGGFSKVVETAKKGGRLDMFNTSFNPTVRYTIWNTIASGLTVGISNYSTSFSIIQRLTSCGTLAKAKSCLLWNVLLLLLFKGSTDFIGIVMYAFFNDCDPVNDKTVKITSGDQLVPYFILTQFGHLPGLPGLCFAGILSAALSSVSSILNSLAAMTVEDYIKPYTTRKNFGENKLVIIAKALAVFYGLLSIVLIYVLANVRGILEASVVFKAITSGPAFGVFALGMLTTKANEIGSLVGLLLGFSLNAWMVFGSMYRGVKYPPLPLSTEGCSVHVNSSFSDILYFANATMSFEISNSTTVSAISTPVEKYVFPLYKVSFCWFAFCATVTTIITGYIASLIVGLWTEKKYVDPMQLSPVVRKWLSDETKKSPNKECIELPNKKEKDYK